MVDVEYGSNSQRRTSAEIIKAASNDECCVPPAIPDHHSGPTAMRLSFRVTAVCVLKAIVVVMCAVDVLATRSTAH